MKLLIIAISFTMLSQINLSAQSENYLEKVKTLDSTIETLYSVISGDAGEERDWDLFRYLYKDGAQMIPTVTGKDGVFRIRYMQPEDYIEKSGKWLDENGFHETEIHREVQLFGNIAHVFSTYECFLSRADEEPFMRGINSIQLVYEQGRWWVVNIYWQQESEEHPIPKEFWTDRSSSPARELIPSLG